MSNAVVVQTEIADHTDQENVSERAIMYAPAYVWYVDRRLATSLQLFSS